MALPIEAVHTRKIALASEYGAEANDMITDGFTEDYFETVARPIRPDAKADAVRVTYAPVVDGGLLIYRVHWFDEDRLRATSAINEDWAETLSRIERV